MLQIYCGNGKGKTTAAVGLAVRAAGAGLQVAFFQFLKNGSSSEIKILTDISGITTEFCRECDKFTFNMNSDEKSAVTARHNEMLLSATDIISRGSADVIVLDEFLDAYNKNMLDRTLAERLVLSCPMQTELVLTGRDPAEKFINRADYISEITAIKHPYQNAVPARKGIEY